MAGAAFKVAGTGADEDFTLADDALAAAPAYAAVGVHDNGAGFHEGVQNAFFHGVEIDFSAGRHDQEADGRCDFFALDDGGAQAQILQAAVVAGSQEGFIDLDAGALADRSDIVDKVGLCYSNVMSSTSMRAVFAPASTQRLQIAMRSLMVRDAIPGPANSMA